MKQRLILTLVLILCGSVLVFGQTSDPDPVPLMVASVAAVVAGILGTVLKWGPKKTNAFQKGLSSLHMLGVSFLGLFKKKKG